MRDSATCGSRFASYPSSRNPEGRNYSVTLVATPSQRVSAMIIFVATSELYAESISRSVEQLDSLRAGIPMK